MNLFVLSDLHILGPDDPLYHSLLSLIRERVRGGDHIVLAGDIFDLFVGSKPFFFQRYAEFFQTIEQAESQGVAIYYIEGNHDFLFQPRLYSHLRMTVSVDQVCLELQGKRFFVAHGDLVDQSDYFYRILRVFFRSPVMKFLVWLCPDRWLDSFGQMLSQKSRKRRPSLTSELSLNKIERLRRVYRSYAAERLAEGFDFVLMGHCHDLDEMFFSIGDRSGQYINMGYPRVHGSFLSWTEGESKVHREKFLL